MSLVRGKLYCDTVELTVLRFASCQKNEVKRLTVFLIEDIAGYGFIRASLTRLRTVLEWF
jgi:hypothetical protein